MTQHNIYLWCMLIHNYVLVKLIKKFSKLEKEYRDCINECSPSLHHFCRIIMYMIMCKYTHIACTLMCAEALRIALPLPPSLSHLPSSLSLTPLSPPIYVGRKVWICANPRIVLRKPWIHTSRNNHWILCAILVLHV